MNSLYPVADFYVLLLYITLLAFCMNVYSLFKCFLENFLSEKNIHEGWEVSVIPEYPQKINFQFQVFCHIYE